MSFSSTRLSVPKGLRERELEDWFRCSRDVRKRIEKTKLLSRRYFLSSAASSGLVAGSSCAVFSTLTPKKADAQVLGLITAFISFLGVVIPAIAELRQSIQPRQRIPATETLQANPNDPTSRYGDNLLAVVDQDTLIAESATAAHGDFLRHIYAKEGLGSEKLESAHRYHPVDADWDLSDRHTFNISELEIFPETAGTKSLQSLTETSHKTTPFEVR